MAYVKDALNRQTTFGYNNTGMFNNSTIANTYAYPVSVTDPDNFSSSIQYDYNNGGVAKTTDPKGASVLRQYDAYDRLYQVTNQVNGAYTRYEFDANQYFVKSFSTIQDNAGELYSITVFDGHDRPRATVSEHPGSAGLYRGAYNVYDTMGRQSQQSNPTEINGAWVPAGDDAVNGSQGGWRWSLQSYDWKGRPLAATDTLGKTKQASYTGCGCAGGLSAIFTDEMGRKQKVISDALGRQWKSQVLKSDGSVYSTVTNTYNVRDQITNVEEKDEATSVLQNTVMTYDGHGRLRTRKRPQEDGPTTFDYYPDDRLQHSKDARNAEGTLTYNPRGLLTQATYISPGNVFPTSSVTFQYDASGLRTLMDEGPGAVTYQYNTLSQLTSETRTFDAIAGKSFTLSYGYTLSGQVSAMTYSATNATSDTINYARDKAGRITAITGSPWGGVTSYASGIQYRAWGAPKAVSYGSGFNASAKYNVRMQVSEFDIPGVIGGTYTYNDDRQLNTFVASTTAQPTQYDLRMNRTFGYDQFGRMNSSVAGGSGFYATYNPQQDAFGNVTNAAYLYWQNGTTSTAFSAAYQNNRATSVTDAAQAQTWTYDAMGNRTSITKTVNGTTTTVESIQVDALGRGVGGGLDGEGQPVVLGGGGNYYVRSTVFGGEVLTKLDNLGSKSVGRVLDGGNLIAEQIMSGQQSVVWHHRDPLNLVARDTEPGQVKRRVLAVTPNGAQIETNEGVNMTTYYACLYGGNNNPTCTGYTPQAASTYGYLADQANGSVGAGLKVDGALTLWSLSDVARQVGRTGKGEVYISPALSGTPITQGGGGSFVRRAVTGWQEVAGTVTSKGGYERDFVETVVDVWEFVPGGEGVRSEVVNVVSRDLIGGDKGNNAKSGSQEKKEPPVESKCSNDPKFWEQNKDAYNRLAKAGIGTGYGQVKPGVWQVIPKTGLSYDETVAGFNAAGWKSFFNGNPEHLGGSDYEKYYKGGWYHLTIGYGSRPTFAGRITDPTKPPVWVTIHCEERYQPSSMEHFLDFMMRKGFL